MITQQRWAVDKKNEVGMKKSISRASWYVFLAYWIAQAISLWFIKGFGSLPIIMSVIILLTCIIGLFMRGSGYKIGASIILFLYSIVLCMMFILFYLFFPPHRNSNGHILYLIFLLIILLNFTLSVVLMIKQARKRVKG